MKDRAGKYPRGKIFTLEELSNLPKSRREAIALGERYYFNGNLCKHNHISPRRTDSKCRECTTQRDNKRYKSNTSKISKRSKVRDLTKLRRSVKYYSKKDAISNHERYYLTACSKCLKDGMIHDVKARIAGCVSCARQYYNEHAKRNYTPKQNPVGHNSIEKLLFMGAKQRAKKKKLDFDLELSDIHIPKYCPILNIPIMLFLEDMTQSSISRANSPSLDRIDNNKGYIKDNVIQCVPE